MENNQLTIENSIIAGMDYRRKLRELNAVPFTHAHFLSYLRGFKYPNNKIKQLVDKGELVRLKRGLYVAGDLYRNEEVSPELVANLLYGPSYVSMDYALSYYGLIPERVYEVMSMTTRQRKEYETPLGRYSFIKSSSCLYPIGIRQQQSSDMSVFMIASKEKALCDKLVYTKNLQITSLSGLRTYLEADLRLEMDALYAFNLEIIQACIKCCKKPGLLSKLAKIIESQRRIA